MGSAACMALTLLPSATHDSSLLADMISAPRTQVKYSSHRASTQRWHCSLGTCMPLLTPLRPNVVASGPLKGKLGSKLDNTIIY